MAGSNPPVKTGNGFLGHPSEAKFNDFESYYDGGTVQEGASIVDSQAQTGDHSSHEVDYDRWVILLAHSIIPNADSCLADFPESPLLL